MRHLRAHRKLGRVTAHRLAMLRNLVTSLLEHERITTTDARAKEVRPIAERMITYGKRGDLHSRRQALRIVRSRTVVGKVFDSVARRFADRPGGYTRIIKLGRRLGDGAPLSIIELLPEPSAEKPAKGGKGAPGKGARGGKEKAADAKAKPARPAKPQAKPKAEKGQPGRGKGQIADKAPGKSPAGRKGQGGGRKGPSRGGGDK
jgi:large subunit ribosomal protein L17